MRRFSAIAAVVALFVSGVVIGVMGTHLFYVSRLRHPGGPRVMADHYSMRLEKHLDLTREQVEAIDHVIETSRSEAADLRHEMWPRVRELMDRTSEEIETILTEEQRKSYDRLRRFQRRRLEMLVLGPGGPGGPPGPRGRPGEPLRRGDRRGRGDRGDDRRDHR